MSIRESIHTTAKIAKGMLDFTSAAVGVYSTGRVLKKAPLVGSGMNFAVTELSTGLNSLLTKQFFNQNIPYTTCTIKDFLEGGNGTGESVFFKPNWSKFNEFVDNHPCYPVSMIGEKIVSNMVFGFHTNLTLTLPLFHIIDDGKQGNDANMLYIAGGIAAVDVLYALTLPSEGDLHPEHN